jgi:hypothetical protein
MELQITVSVNNHGAQSVHKPLRRNSSINFGIPISAEDDFRGTEHLWLIPFGQMFVNPAC